LIPLLRAELIKLRTTRTFLALAGAAIATSLLIVVLTALLEEPTADQVLDDVFTSDTSTLFILVLAIVGISGEWRHRTITSSLLASPDRLRFLAAKTIAFAAAGLLLSLAVSLAISVVGYVILSSRDLPTPEAGEIVGQVLRNAFLAALTGAFGVGIGAVVRNQPVAIVGVLLFSFVLEPLLGSLASEVARFGPFTGLPLAIQGIPGEDFGFEEGTELLAAGVATIVMLAWIGAFFAAGYTLLRVRDVD
jgi:ABC-2 type transport system permease protein